MELLKTYYDNDGKITLSPQDMTAREFYRDYLAVHTFNEMFIGCPQQNNIEKISTSNGFIDRCGNTAGAEVIGRCSDYDAVVSQGECGSSIIQAVGSFFNYGDITIYNSIYENYVGKEIRLRSRVKSADTAYDSNIMNEEQFTVIFNSYATQSNPYCSTIYFSMGNRVETYANFEGYPQKTKLWLTDDSKAIDGQWHTWEVRANLSTKLMSMLLDGVVIKSSTYTEPTFYESDSWNGNNLWDKNRNYINLYWVLMGGRRSVSSIALEYFQLEVV